MGYLQMPKLGEPNCCENECNHPDCIALKKSCLTPCSICGEVIKAGEKFFIEEMKPLKQCHTNCYWKKEETK